MRYSELELSLDECVKLYSAFEEDESGRVAEPLSLQVTGLHECPDKEFAAFRVSL